MEAKADRIVYSCRINISMKTVSDSHADSYGALLATLLSAKRQMSVIALGAAIGQGLPYKTVPEAEVMFGEVRREKSSRLFFLEVRPHRSQKAL